MKSLEEFEQAGREIHDMLDVGLNAIDVDGDASTFCFDGRGSEIITVESFEIPEFIDRIGIKEFTSVYAPQLKRASGEELGDHFVMDVEILAASIESARRQRLRDNAFKLAVQSRTATWPEGSMLGKFPVYKELAAQVVDYEIAAYGSKKYMEVVYAQLAEFAELPELQEVEA